jgi:hypothetical protein
MMGRWRQQHCSQEGLCGFVHFACVAAGCWGRFDRILRRMIVPWHAAAALNDKCKMFSWQPYVAAVRYDHTRTSLLPLPTDCMVTQYGSGRGWAQQQRQKSPFQFTSSSLCIHYYRPLPYPATFHSFLLAQSSEKCQVVVTR